MNNSAKICPSCGEPFIRNLSPESYLDETCNLWFQGEIPEQFRAWLPDNARFKGGPENV